MGDGDSNIFDLLYILLCVYNIYKTNICENVAIIKQ